MLIRLFSLFVGLWGFLVMITPWLIDHDQTSANMIVSGLGVAILASAVSMWRKA